LPIEKEKKRQSACRKTHVYVFVHFEQIIRSAHLLSPEKTHGPFGRIVLCNSIMNN